MDTPVTKARNQTCWLCGVAEKSLNSRTAQNCLDRRSMLTLTVCECGFCNSDQNAMELIVDAQYRRSQQGVADIEDRRAAINLRYLEVVKALRKEEK